ncbi:MAG: transposase, partial [Pseudomonadota bacterium]
HAIEQDRPDVLGKRRAWFGSQPDLDPERLVFVDETWTATNMARSHGRCRRGKRLRMGVPHSHRKTTTFVAGLRLGGMVAPMVLDGPINGARHCRSDQWRNKARGSRPMSVTCSHRPSGPATSFGAALEPMAHWRLTLDNLSSHKRVAAREAIEARGARLRFLPPYSPDLNPIELAFAKLKALLRRAAERTVEALWHRIGALTDAFSPGQCANYFTACGYEPD